MTLDTDRWAILSGVESKNSDKTLNESVTMGMAGPGFVQQQPQQPVINESEELHRLRMIVREEVEAVISEIQAEKDLQDVAQKASAKSISATMGFSGPGFSNHQPTDQNADQFDRRAPTAGLIRGPGF